MEQQEVEILQSLAKKMDVIAALLLRMLPNGNDGLSLKEQIRLLEGLGMRPIEIAKVVGRTPNHVNKELVAIQKEK